MAELEHALRRVTIYAALSVVALVLCGCDEEAKVQDASQPMGIDAGAGRPSEYHATLIYAVPGDAGSTITAPHQVSLLDNVGNPLTPPVETTSGPTGQIDLPLPAAAASIYVVGVGPAEDLDSTYDTVLLNHNWSSGDPLIRLSSRRILALAAADGVFVPRPDRASLRGMVTWTTNGVRRGTVGCAKVFIDGAREPDEDQSQRYGSLLPVPLAVQDQTNRGGTFYFGNVKVGLHSMRVTLDNGQTFAPVQSIFVGRTRQGAQSPLKAMLYQFAFDIEAISDPTPADCPL